MKFLACFYMYIRIPQAYAVATARHVFERLFLQHMRSVNFLIVATPFFVCLPVICVGTLSTSSHTRSVITVILHAMLSCYINLV